MANMSYCRFYNIFYDLLDCSNASEEEKRYAKKLIELCIEIVEQYKIKQKIIIDF